VAGNFIGEGNWGTQRKLATCHNSLTNFITYVIKSVKEAYNILKER
jgi:hypothetical protein